MLKKLIKFILIGIILFLIILFFYEAEKIILNQNDRIYIKKFDVILTSGQSAQSKLLKFFNFSIQGYSHIGIIDKNKNGIYILHSTPDGTSKNSIRYDDFQTFLNLSSVNSYRILRIDSIKNLEEINLILNQYREEKIPFDYHFNNYNKDKIYCSELVFDIFSKNNLIKTKLDLSKSIHPKKFLDMPEFKTIIERYSFSNLNVD